MVVVNSDLRIIESMAKFDYRVLFFSRCLNKILCLYAVFSFDKFVLCAVI